VIAEPVTGAGAPLFVRHGLAAEQTQIVERKRAVEPELEILARVLQQQGYAAVAYQVKSQSKSTPKSIEMHASRSRLSFDPSRICGAWAWRA